MADPVVFHDRDTDNAHAEFQKWRRENFDGGYFLNYVSSSKIVLHRSACTGYFGDTDWERDREGWGNLTRNKKLCFTDRDALRQWAREKGIQNLKQCQDCM